MIRALVTLAALYATTAATLVAAACITRARENARHRAVRQHMRAALYDPVIDIEEWWM